MSGLDQMLRLQKWSLDEKRRQSSDLEALIERLQDDIRRADGDVAHEIEIAGQDLQLQRALPEYRKVMAERRLRIEKSIADLTAELEKLREQIMEAFGELKKTEQTILNRQKRQQKLQRRREQNQADDMGLVMHRRKKDSTL
jgi:chromosome segregation ATPase